MKLSALATIAAFLTLPACDNGDDKATESDATTGTATDAATDPTTTPTTEPTTTPTTGATDATDATTDATDTGEMTTASGPSFATEVWEPILSMKCSPCHTAGSSGGLMMGMDADTAYAAMVDVKSSSSLDYVEPGDSVQSYIFHKLSGTQAEVPMGSGGKMPQVGEITADELATITAWIDGGAAK